MGLGVALETGVGDGVRKGVGVGVKDGVGETIKAFGPAVAEGEGARDGTSEGAREGEGEGDGARAKASPLGLDPGRGAFAASAEAISGGASAELVAKGSVTSTSDTRLSF